MDKALTECCIEHEYGLYTDLAKQAREKIETLRSYRQSDITGFKTRV